MQNITHDRGDSLSLDVRFEDSEGTPIDLTGASIVFTIKKDYDDEDAAASAEAVLAVDPTTGVFNVSIDADTMKTLTEVGAYYYDFQMTDSNEIVTTPIKGKFLNTFDVTT